MSTLARYVVKGVAAYLVIMNAKKIAESSGKSIYQLDNDPLMLAVYDSRAETLVVFDGPGLVALAISEMASYRSVEQTSGVDVMA